jgi:hypothetical protein
MRTTKRSFSVLLSLVLLSLFAPLPFRDAAPQPVGAQLRTAAGGNPAIGSVVDCIRAGDDIGLASAAAPQFAVTCLGSLLHYDSYEQSSGTSGNAPPSDAALARFGDTKPDSRFEPTPATQAQIGALGAVYGLAYASGTNPAAAGTPGAFARTFVAAFTKRGTRFGPLGPGGIYTYAERYSDSASDPRTTRPYLFIPGVVEGPGNGPLPTYPGDGSSLRYPDQTTAATYNAGRGGVHTPFSSASGWNETDPTVIGHVGRSGLGDIDLDPDERLLYVVNLRDKRIYQFDTWSTTPQYTLRQLPHFPNLAAGTACGASRDAQPFALHVTRAWLYLGVTCTAESTQNPADLRLRVWRYDRSGDTANQLVGTWDSTPALQLDLANYSAQRSYGSSRTMAWRPWSSTVPCGVSFGGHYLCPQPLLTDIEMDEQGVLLLGLRDRFGDLTGMEPLPRSIPAGDIMRALPNPSAPGRWLAPVATPAGEFFDDWHTVEGSLEDKTEVSAGGLAYVPGNHAGNRAGNAGEVVTTWLDPYEGSSFGVAWFDTAAPGRPTAREQVYPSSTALRYFGKAQGLGDIELLCAWSAIGDRVWNDINANGIQDSGEPGIGGVDVQLFDAGDTAFARPLATVTTGDVDGDGINGEYRFYVQPWRSYVLRLEPTQFNPASGALRSWRVTRQNQGDDTRDSDANPLTRVIGSVAPQGRGEHNESYDFGLTQASGNAILGDRIWHDVDGDGLQGAGEPGIAGVALSIAECNDDARLNCTGWRTLATATTNATGYYSFGSLAPNHYLISFVPPAGYLLTRANAGDDARDSDVLAGKTWFEPITASWDTNNTSYDAGFIAAFGDASVRIDGPDRVLQNQQAEYSVRVTGGTAPMLNVPLVVTITPGARSVSADGATISGTPDTGFTVAWTLPVLPAGQSETRSLRVSYRDLDTEDLAATIAPSPPDSDPSNNRSALRTTVVSPNVAITQLRQPRVAPGAAFIYRLTVSNLVSQPASTVPTPYLDGAQTLTVTNTLPAGVEYYGFVSSGTADLIADSGASGSPRTLTWRVPSLATGGTQTIDVSVRVRTTTPLPVALLNRASVSTGALTTPADGQADNANEQSTLVDYPDLAVDITVDGSNGPATRGEGSSLVYTVSYDNLLGLVPAEGVSMTLTLPREITLGSPSNAAYLAGTALDGRPTLIWNLGTLAAGAGRASISVPVVVNVGAAAAGTLRADATIGTITPEPATANNQDTFQVLVVAPPQLPDVRSSSRMRLAIHSTLDPRARTSNAVYVSDSADIAWPAGEVLDFTPLTVVDLPALTAEERAFYLVRATVTGWRLVSFGGPGGTLAAAGNTQADRDVFGRAGCRGSGVASGERASGCGYRYLGPSVFTSDDAGTTAPAAPAQSDMASQAHSYWSDSPPPAMRADVYTLAAPGLPGVSLRLEVLVRVEVLARETGLSIRSEPEAQRLGQIYGVRLVAPRSAK